MTVGFMRKLALRFKRSLAYRLVAFINRHYPDKKNSFVTQQQLEKFIKEREPNAFLEKKRALLEGKQADLEVKYASLETRSMSFRAQIAALRDQIATWQAERNVLLEQIRGQQAVIKDQHARLARARGKGIKDGLKGRGIKGGLKAR